MSAPIKFGGFQFKKVAKPKSIIVANNRVATIADENELNEKKPEIDFITSIDDKVIKGTRTNSSTPIDPNDIVIPLIKVNKYKKIKTDQKTQTDGDNQCSDDKDNDDDDDLLTKAKKELIKESKINDQENDNLPAWKQLMINKAPNEYENDTKCDVSLRPEEPKLEDYEKIPVTAFGAAMLRGMGWKEGEAIGGVNKAVTPVIEPKLRARGLGLGADVSLDKQRKHKQ